MANDRKQLSARRRFKVVCIQRSYRSYRNGNRDAYALAWAGLDEWLYYGPDHSTRPHTRYKRFIGDNNTGVFSSMRVET